VPDIVAKLEALYARIPKMKDCKGKCADSCTVIPCTPFEKKRLEAAMGQVFEPKGRPPFPVRCSALTREGKCSQYDLRPAICRAFGAMNHPFMRCEHGCTPERWMSPVEFSEILLEIEALCGPMTIPELPGWKKLSPEQAEAAAALFLQERP
jgi:Fe-S-cluster containining protein